MKRFKRIYLIISSSFTLNFIFLLVLIAFSVLKIGGLAFWQVISVLLSMSVCFLNANYFKYIKHKL